MAKIAIITAECGGGNLARDPKTVYPNADYFLFSDSPENAFKVWNNVPIIQFSDDKRYSNRRTVKFYKMLSTIILPGYDYYIWHDACHEVVANPKVIIEQSGVNERHPFAFFRHRARGCLFEEAKIIIREGLDYPQVVRSQMHYYKTQGLPKGFGLYETAVIVRTPGPLCQQMELMWWEQICRYSSRDQLTLPYVIWKLGIEPKIIPGNAVRNSLVTRTQANIYHRRTMFIPLKWRIYDGIRYTIRDAIRWLVKRW